MPIAQIDDYAFTSWDGDQLEPASTQVAVIEAPPKVDGRAYVYGGQQAPFANPIITGFDAGTTREAAEQLAQLYRDLKDAGGVTVYNSIGTRYDDVMVVDVRCHISWNTVTFRWRVRAVWRLDVGAGD